LPLRWPDGLLSMMARGVEQRLRCVSGRWNRQHRGMKLS